MVPILIPLGPERGRNQDLRKRGPIPKAMTKRNACRKKCLAGCGDAEEKT